MWPTQFVISERRCQNKFTLGSPPGLEKYSRLTKALSPWERRRGSSLRQDFFLPFSAAATESPVSRLHRIIYHKKASLPVFSHTSLLIQVTGHRVFYIRSPCSSLLSPCSAGFVIAPHRGRSGNRGSGCASLYRCGTLRRHLLPTSRRRKDPALHDEITTSLYPQTKAINRDKS